MFYGEIFSLPKNKKYPDKKSGYGIKFQRFIIKFFVNGAVKIVVLLP